MAKISKCGRLSSPALWSTFGRTVNWFAQTCHLQKNSS